MKSRLCRRLIQKFWWQVVPGAGQTCSTIFSSFQLLSCSSLAGRVSFSGLLPIIKLEKCEPQAGQTRAPTTFFSCSRRAQSERPAGLYLIFRHARSCHFYTCILTENYTCILTENCAENSDYPENGKECIRAS